jgi:putative sigma-54 modulation protein
MKLNYTGQQEALTPSQERKLAARVAKLGKLLDRRGEREGHVVLSSVRHLHHAELTVHFYDNPLVGVGSAADQYTAIADAFEKVEKQLLRLRARKRDTKRNDTPRKVSAARQVAAAVAPPAKPAKRKEKSPASPAKVVRASGKGNGKPMTVDEAVLAMEDGRDYVVYRDAETSRTSILVRRADGKMDLIEA